MQVRETAPRTRGGGPYVGLVADATSDCSPHARGWTPDWDNLDSWTDLLPARAGASLPGSSALAMRSPRPRARRATVVSPP